MKRLSQILAVGVITLTPFVVSGSAFAAGTLGTCGIGFTGPDSSNICTSVTKYNCTVNSDNLVTVTNQNIQFSVSGNAGSIGNTGSGSASTGSATNANGTTFNATVTGPSTCSVVATVPATTTPVSSVKTPPAVGGAVQAVPAPAGKGAVAVLPNTSSDSTLAVVAGLISILGVGAVISRLVVMSYGRIKS